MSGGLFNLGGFEFSVRHAPPQRLERSQEWRWPSQALIGRAPALQWVGPGAERITFDGVIFPEHEPGRLDGLRWRAAMGLPLPLSDGGGAFLGFHVIASLTETVPVIGPGGRALQQEWRLVLQRYGGEERWLRSL